MTKDGRKIQDAIDLFLFDYRTTKHCLTGETPSRLMFNREIRTRFNLLQPDIAQTVVRKQEKQINNKGGKRQIEFADGEAVWARDFRKDSADWSQAEITERLGTVTYKIRFENGVETKRHANQLTRRVERDIEQDFEEPIREEEKPRRSERLKKKASVARYHQANGGELECMYASA